jgi:hypothetical protein
VQIWLLANMGYCVMVMPYIYRACLTPLTASLASQPIWIVSSGAADLVRLLLER